MSVAEIKTVDLTKGERNVRFLRGESTAFVVKQKGELLQLLFLFLSVGI